MVDHQTAVDAAKLVPPVIGLTVAEVLPPVQLAAYSLTAIYTVLMISNFIWTKWIRPHLRKR
jgi:hypothetical protein